MDLPKRVLPHGSPRGSPMATRRRDAEADENVRAWSENPGRLGAVAEWTASLERKKVLGERNGGGDGSGEAASPPQFFSQAKPATSPPSLSCRGEGPYDPKTNYTTPRPEFLRYNPEKRREILLRLEREAEDESSSATSATPTPTPSECVSSGSSVRGGEAELDRADAKEEEIEIPSPRGLDRADAEEEEIEIPSPRGGWARRLLLLLVAAACSCCYIYCMSSSPFPTSQMGLDFAGTTGSVHDASAHQVGSLELRAPTEMMGSHHVFEEATDQTVPNGSENAAQLYGPMGGSRKNFMAIAAMGLADSCPNVPFGEFTCQIGDRAVEDVQNSKEDFQLSELMVATSENAEQLGEVVSLNENVTADSIGSTYTADMVEGESGLVHQEEAGEDHSQHSQQLASMEKTIEQENNEVGYDGEGLENDRLDQATELLEYENPAAAAKAIVAMVKSLWPSIKLHLMEILACFSVAAFAIAAAMLKCFQRSPKGASVSTRRLEQSPLAPNPRLPVLPSPQSVLQPVQLTVPKVEPPVNLKIPTLSPLHKPDLFASFREQVPLPEPIPVSSVNLNNAVQFPLPKQIDSGNRPQKVHQDDAGSARIPDSYSVGRRDIDSSRPPVVALLGEFSLVDASSSRGSSRKGSNEHAGDVAVQEPSVTLRKDVVKMQKETTAIKSPSARKTKKEENAAKVEKKDVTTPTPLRRSNRLLNRVTSP
ncbi:uncharacterized protein [Oryza sativa Japonica Group]|uniref:Os01g0765500 protein n=3 Tax=Oryza TaxID=4527 RepID=Q0JJ13_ORYSJ|nr:uncharacterized protein LOC4326899 [Oryza sativa Japonica Group]KAF2952447.1 hypothetical protein DAI22_01g337500 [Oryza sativa Japonica Group]BAF06265.1 Os01g0765500 [Oryza sativa Japonica Group]BAS74501.1 Os01g0765500 [Oryza sativa Japonica Group]|eukprot:NP_001044351.1 Os01g0765500 [Oryza sativa Japonica Group]